MTKWMRVLALVLGSLVVAQAVDVKQYVTSHTYAVANNTNTTIRANLNNTTAIQLYIDPGSTAQIFTLTLGDGSTISVPTEQTLNLNFAANLLATDVIGTVQTGTGSANLKQISVRAVKQ